jgi:hypothetical protein
MAKGWYVFPAQPQMHAFSDTRVNPLREQSEYLQSITRQAPDWVWNKSLKRFAQQFVYRRGSESKTDLIAVDADVLALDEYDQLHPPNVPEAEKRISWRRGRLPLIRVGFASSHEIAAFREWRAASTRAGASAPAERRHTLPLP